MEELLSELKRIKDKVNTEISRIKNSLVYPKELYEAAFHLLSKGGKRLRPFVLIKSTELFSGDVNLALPVAVSVELLHNFTLIHDDIMDQDEMRRGVKTTHVIWGVPIAMTAGDALFALLFKYLVEELKRKGMEPDKIASITEIIADGAIKVCEGQTMDVLAQDYIKTEDDYFEMVSKKTSTLFRISAMLGGLVAGADEKSQELLSLYGENLGISFQIADDILGLVGDPKITGKPLGSDLREGKRTIIVLHALKSLSKTNKMKIKAVLGNRNVSETQILEVIDILKQAGSIDYAREKARKFAEKAVEYLSNLPDNDHRKYLEMLAKFTYTRQM